MKPYVIVTVQDGNKQFNYDMEIPTDVQVGQLAGDILEALSCYNTKISLPKGSCSLFCKRLNRGLYINETFGTAGIWNGDIIIIK